MSFRNQTRPDVTRPGIMQQELNRETNRDWARGKAAGLGLQAGQAGCSSR